MPATIATIDAALKDTWTQERLENQLYDENPFLDQLEKTSRFHIGKQAQTPIITNRNGGYTAHPAAGSTALNAAGNVGTAQATWGYTYHMQQVKLERAALDQTDGKAVSVANVLDLEVEGAMSEIKKQLTRQVVAGNGDSLIAECTTTTASTTVNLLSTGFGYDAIVRGHLHPGLTIDIGSTANETSRSADNVITAVGESSSAPTLTVTSSVTTAASDFVSIANARSGTTAYEMNGLRNVISQTADLGGLTVSSNPTWKAASVDTSTTSLTLDVLYDVRRAVRQKTGGDATDTLLTSLKQEANFYKLLQMQVRFDKDAVEAGNSQSSKFAGHQVIAHPDVYDRHAFFVSKKNLFLVAIDKPYWVNKYEGGNILQWSPGTSAFVSALCYDVQLATNRRNAHAAITSLTA